MAEGSISWSILTVQSTGDEVSICREREKLSFGTYPDISLAEARTKRDEARKTLANDKDPGEVKKAELLAQKLSVTNTLKR
jgi:hypothetical protein